MPLLGIFTRAFLQVSLVALNPRIVAYGELPAAFVTGTLLSWVWWANARSAAHDKHKWARGAYCLGAGCGTVFGMALFTLWR